MMTTTKTTKKAMDNNAIIILEHYYDHMRCTRSKLTEVPWCEPFFSLDDYYTGSCLFLLDKVEVDKKYDRYQ